MPLLAWFIGGPWSADLRHAEMHCASGSANNVDGVEDFGSFGRFQVAEVVFHAAYQPTDAVDLRVAGGGLDAGPFVELGGGGDAFPVRQQLVEVGAEFGEVGDVGAEVAAAGAAEPERAGTAAGLDVGRFGAVAERHRDLADPLPGSFAVQESVGVAPDVGGRRRRVGGRRACRPRRGCVSR